MQNESFGTNGAVGQAGRGCDWMWFVGREVHVQDRPHQSDEDGIRQ